MTKPIAVTMGDPAGVSAEITLAAWQNLKDTDQKFFIIADPTFLSQFADGLDVEIIPIESAAQAKEAFARGLPVLPEVLSAPIKIGKPNLHAAQSVINAIERAVDLVKQDEASAVVTNPINKKMLFDGAGFSYPGHTEFLASLSGGNTTVMMLAAPILRVVPVTIHNALSEVPKLLTTDLIIETAKIIHQGLRNNLGITVPRIAVTGLNPHAGEGGRMGNEEIDVIIPAIDALKAEGIDVSGPHPADTMFHAAAREKYDVALCMYHDQALIPLKALDFSGGVNVTLGLDFIRTSPDHGTAYDIAGKGIAEATSLIAAINMAAEMAKTRGNTAYE